MRFGKISSAGEASPPSSAGAGPCEPAYDIRIARDGSWFHEGTRIERLELVKLFSTVLRRDDADDYWLVTPVERGRIIVEDVPFLAVEVRASGMADAQSLAFRTNVDDWVTAGPDHPIRMAGVVGEAALSEGAVPYILVRDRLEARIVQSVFYELVDLAVECDTSRGVELGVWSERIFFPLGVLTAATQS